MMSTMRVSVYSRGDSLAELRESVLACLSVETAHPAYSARWSLARPTLGQCYVAAAVAAFLLNIPQQEAVIDRGVVRTVDGAIVHANHCWLTTGGLIIDFTIDQACSTFPRTVMGRPTDIAAMYGLSYEAQSRDSLRDAQNGSAASRVQLALGRAQGTCSAAA